VARKYYINHKANVYGFEFYDPNEQTKVKTDSNVKTKRIYKLDLSNIVGHEPIKTTLIDMINATKPFNLLLSGSPSTSKTFLIKTVQSQIEDQNPDSTLFVDCATSTFSGLSSEIDNIRPTVLFLDELESFDTRTQRTLLNLLQNQVLHINKHRNNQTIHLPNLKVIGTVNDLSKLLESLRSRMLILYLSAPTELEYKYITRKMLLHQFNYISPEVADYIGSVKWNIKPSYLRLVNRVAILIKSEPTREKVDQVINNLNRYSVPDSEMRKLRVQR
jgi:replication-associated recombination protein RarA